MRDANRAATIAMLVSLALLWGDSSVAQQRLILAAGNALDCPFTCLLGRG